MKKYDPNPKRENNKNQWVLDFGGTKTGKNT
jgi:hypothetical protein